MVQWIDSLDNDDVCEYTAVLDSILSSYTEEVKKSDKQEKVGTTIQPDKLSNDESRPVGSFQKKQKDTAWISCFNPNRMKPKQVSLQIQNRTDIQCFNEINEDVAKLHNNNKISWYIAKFWLSGKKHMRQ